MTLKLKVRFLSLALAAFAMFSMTSCSDDSGSMEDGGSETSKTEVSTDTSGGTQDKDSDKDAKFTEEYFRWLRYSAFSSETGFVDAMNKTTFPADLEAYFSAFEEKREKHYTDIFCPIEIINAAQAVYQHEAGETLISGVSNVKKSKNWIYNLNMSFSGKESAYEIMFSESKKEIKLVKYDEQGNVLSFHEIVSVDGGYIAVNRGDKSSGKWSSLQLLFKTGEGYCTMTSGSDTEPASIFGAELPTGFAGK